VESAIELGMEVAGCCHPDHVKSLVSASRRLNWLRYEAYLREHPAKCAKAFFVDLAQQALCPYPGSSSQICCQRMFSIYFV
jgi:hypothetical protein